MSPRSSDRVLTLALRAASIASGSIVVLIVAFLVAESLPGLARVGPARFVTDPSWHPNADPASFALVPMIVASLATTAGAILVAAPVGVLAAVFCRFHAPPRVAQVFRGLVELLAGIPSVVYGFWGLVTLVPLVAKLEPPGASLLSGVLVLALMIVPTVTLLAVAALENVPRAHVLGAAALGLSRWTTIRGVVLPWARSGLGIAIVLGTLRAIGETMAVLMVCGNVARVPSSLFDPVRTLTANIALELGYATREHRSVLFVSGLALMAIVVALVGVQGRLARRTSGA